MEDLFKLFLTKEVLLYAAIAVGLTEALMRKTPDSITRWRYAPWSALVIALLLSVGHSFLQDAVGMKLGLERGVKASIVATVGYNHVKSLITGVFKKQNT